MGISELLWAFRRRWRLIVVAIAVCMALAWLTTPARAGQEAPKAKVTYHATETLIPAGQGVSLDRLALLATQGNVPSDVRAQFGIRTNNTDVKIARGTGGRSI